MPDNAGRQDSSSSRNGSACSNWRAARATGWSWASPGTPAPCPQKRRRRGEINAFKAEPRNAASSSAPTPGRRASTLQNASVVINCDLPWNPAKLEQRIARAWRKHQTRAVTVVNLVSEKTIEHRMLATLSHKRALADGVLDRIGNLKEIKLHSGRQAFLVQAQADHGGPANPRGREARGAGNETALTG
jgi:hypothetical protein